MFSKWFLTYDFADFRKNGEISSRDMNWFEGCKWFIVVHGDLFQEY